MLLFFAGLKGDQGLKVITAVIGFLLLAGGGVWIACLQGLISTQYKAEQQGEVLGVLNQVTQLSTFSAYPVGVLLAYSISIRDSPQGGAGVGVSWTVASAYLLIGAAVQVIYANASSNETDENENENKEGNDNRNGINKEIDSSQRSSEKGKIGYSRTSVLFLERRAKPEESEIAEEITQTPMHEA